MLQVVTVSGLSKRALGSFWSGLHTFAKYAYWAYFAFSFFDRVVGPSRPDPFVPIGFV